MLPLILSNTLQCRHLSYQTHYNVATYLIKHITMSPFILSNKLQCRHLSYQTHYNVATYFTQVKRWFHFTYALEGCM